MRVTLWITTAIHLAAPSVLPAPGDSSPDTTIFVFSQLRKDESIRL